jgi:hypothetical protein
VSNRFCFKLIKLECVADYKASMHLVDSADQYLALYPLMRKTSMWPKKVFFCLMQCTLFNSYSLFQKSNREVRISELHENYILYLTTRKGNRFKAIFLHHQEVLPQLLVHDHHQCKPQTFLSPKETPQKILHSVDGMRKNSYFLKFQQSGVIVVPQEDVVC